MMVGDIYVLQEIYPVIRVIKMMEEEIKIVLL